MSDNVQFEQLVVALGLPSVARDEEMVDGLGGSSVQVFQSIGGGVFLGVTEPNKTADVVLPIEDALRLVVLILRECAKAQP